ncbi:MAG: N-acetyltransferase [Bryobacteraceae bacterium]
MGDVEIVAVQDKQSLEQFVDLPYRLYRHHPYWVPPLRMAQKELLNTKKHPFYAHADMQCFLARRDGQVRGRVAAIVDRNYNEFQKENAGFFGFFESTDDVEVARAVMQAARKWLLERGAKVIRGPMNPSTNYECGMLVEGFDSAPNVMMPYNSPSYPRMLEAVGLRKAKDLLAYWSTPTEVHGAKVERVARRAAGNQGVVIRTIDMRKFDEEVQMLWKLYNDTWAQNWGFVPMTREEFLHEAAEMKQILKPELVLIGEVAGRAVGFALALPNINLALKHAGGKLFPLGLFKILYHQRLIKELRVVALGVVEEYRTLGVAAGFYAELIRNARRMGYGLSEMSWVLEDNVLMNRSLKTMGAKKYKTYRIYEWN